MAQGVQVTEEEVRAIAAKHGLGGTIVRMRQLGIVNDIWSIGGKYVLRIPKELEYAESIYAESVAAPAAVEAGVRTPEIVLFDDTLELVDVPYMVTRFVPGSTLGATPKSPTWELAAYEWASVVEELAVELVRLHQTVKAIDDPRGWLNPWWLDDTEEKLERYLSLDRLSSDEARWCVSFVAKLRGAFSYEPTGRCDQVVFVHHDLHPYNVMVTDPPAGESSRLVAVLDWGNACWGDPAVDFCGFPLWALPPLVDAYRLAGGQTDETFEGRVLYMWIGIALGEPLFLDPVVFARHWWRMPEDGIRELMYRLPLLPRAWNRWAPG